MVTIAIDTNIIRLVMQDDKAPCLVARINLHLTKKTAIFKLSIFADQTLTVE